MRAAKPASRKAADTAHHAVWMAWDEAQNLDHARKTTADLDAMKRNATQLVIKIERALEAARIAEKIIMHDIEEVEIAAARLADNAKLTDIEYDAARQAILKGTHRQ